MVTLNFLSYLAVNDCDSRAVGFRRSKQSQVCELEGYSQ